jgi:hypothetical protein
METTGIVTPSLNDGSRTLVQKWPRDLRLALR